MSSEQTKAQKELADNYKKIGRFSVAVMELKNHLNLNLKNDLLLICECSDTTFRISAVWNIGSVPLFEFEIRCQDLEISKITVYPNKQPIIGYNELKSILISESVRFGLYNLQRSMLYLEI